MSVLSSIIGISVLMVSDTIPPATQLQQAEVVGDKSEEVAPQTLQSKTIMGNAVISGVEGIIRTLPGVVATDELSSQYSVRGGSFDENLMLINGFEVYKPQLARSGQQEGLSAIHPDMVGQLEFSTGGFSALHGDKLSSVLAVDYRLSGFEDFRNAPTQFRTRFGFYEQRVTLAHQKEMPNGRINVHMLGLRNKSNRLFQRGLDTEGDYESRAQDFQYMFHSLGEQWNHEALILGQNSVYSLFPSSRTTEFGTITEVLRLSVYMAGKESYAYQNAFAGWRSTWHPSRHSKVSLNAQWMQALESESADVESAYLLGEVDENLGSDDFGEITYWRGSGGHMRHARNAMWTQTGEISVRGEHRSERSTWYWGTGLRQTNALDVIDEWVNLDSAGYSLPHHQTLVAIDSADTTLTFKDRLMLHQTTKSQGEFTNIKQWSMAQWAYQLTENQSITLGVRQIYDTRSGELRISPRASWQMTLNKEWQVDIRGGSYAQTASVRELRNWKLNQLETDAYMQHAWHGILGASRTFKRSGRPMYWRGEAYIKYLDRAYPFEQDGMRLRYLGTTPIQARVRGIDQRLHTEWVDGAESWLSLSFFDAKDLVNDEWQRRPTDYGMSMSLRVEDQLPDAPDNRVYVQIQYTGGFPFGAPLSQEIPFQSSAYRRMDLGLERVIHVNGFNRLSLTLEVFNLLEIQNTASYFWIMDISTAREYAVPNYLTQRLINLSLRAEF